MIGILGLGLSGSSAASFLKGKGKDVIAWDDGEDAHEKASACKTSLIDLEDPVWSRIEALVLSPGIPHTYPAPHKLVNKVRRYQIPIISDIEIFFQDVRGLPLGRPCVIDPWKTLLISDPSMRKSAQSQDTRPPYRIIGITGTNGKSTTAALIAHCLKENGVPVALGGNIGTPVLSLPTLPRDHPKGPGFYVLELSSYQLEMIPSLDLDVSVLLNVAPDHLARHGDLKTYVSVKKRILEGQRAESLFIVGSDDDFTRGIVSQLQQARQKTIVITGRSASTVPEEARAFNALDGGDLPFSLQGEHNLQNARSAFASVSALGLTREAYLASAASFPGLAHRQESLGMHYGALWINDSKATNSDALLQAFERFIPSYPTYWIAGGRRKDQASYQAQFAALRSWASRLEAAFFFGQDRTALAKMFAGCCPIFVCPRLCEAAAQALCYWRETASQASARPDPDNPPLMLFSPGCVSFDHYRNFEMRGQAFRNIVHHDLNRFSTP